MSESIWMQRSRECLSQVKKHPLSEEQRPLSAIELAGWILEEARRIQTPSDRRQQRRLASIIEDPLGKLFVVSVTDQCFRSQQCSRVADQLIYLIKTLGVPSHFSFLEKVQLIGFKWLGRALSGVLAPLVKHMIRRDAQANLTQMMQQFDSPVCHRATPDCVARGFCQRG